MTNIYLKAINPTVLIHEDDFISTDGLRKYIDAEVIVSKMSNEKMDTKKEIIETYVRYFIQNPNEFELYKTFFITGYPIVFRPIGNVYIVEELSYDEKGRPFFVSGLEKASEVWDSFSNKEVLAGVDFLQFDKNILVDEEILLNWNLTKTSKLFKGVEDSFRNGLILVPREKEGGFSLLEVPFFKILYYLPNLADFITKESGIEVKGNAFDFKVINSVSNEKYKRLPVSLLVKKKVM